MRRGLFSPHCDARKPGGLLPILPWSGQICAPGGCLDKWSWRVGSRSRIAQSASLTRSSMILVTVQPWWRASVDGVDAEILKANVIFRAVVCPRGRHVIRFSFHPFAGAFAETMGKLTHAPASKADR